MPPKSDLLTEGTTDPWEKKSYNPFPITTKGKMEKAAAKHSNHKKIKPIEAPVEKKPGKARYMAPPEEAAATAALTRARQKVALKGKPWNDDKPVTTQAKIRAAEAKKRAIDPVGAAFKEADKAKNKMKAAVERAGKKASSANEAHATTTAHSKRALKVKPPGTISVIHSQDGSPVKFAKGDKAKQQSVLFRRTKKADKILNARRAGLLALPELSSLWADKDVKMALKGCKMNAPKLMGLLRTSEDLHAKVVKLVEVGLLPAPGVLELDDVDLRGDDATFQFMDLPKELRLQIYQLVVVEDKIFIRPECLMGREQPGLAMVSRQVRSEVLPVFYGKNTFGVEVGSVHARLPFPGSKAKPKTFMMEDWVKAICTPSRVSPVCSLSYIRHWVIDSAASAFTRSDEADGDSALMLSVRFTRDAKTRRWSANVEVHRDATCIMPGWEEHGTCIPKLTPDWVNDLVIRVCDNAKEEGVTGKAIMGLVQALKSSMKALIENRCELTKRDNGMEIKEEHGV